MVQRTFVLTILILSSYALVLAVVAGHTPWASILAIGLTIGILWPRAIAPLSEAARRTAGHIWDILVAAFTRPK